MTTLYLDLDGVLCDFVQQCSIKFGCLPDAFPSRNKLMLAIKEEPNFFSTMPEFSYTQALFEFCRNFAEKKGREFKILTAFPPSADNHCAEDKRKWVRNNLSSNVEVVTVTAGKDKYKQAKPGDILIDDMIENIEPWIKAGGRGIHHVNARNTITVLRGLYD